MKRVHLISALLIAGCATTSTVSPGQQALNAAVLGCNGVGAAITSVDGAILSGALKGSNRENAVKGLGQAKAGCDVAVTALQAAATAAASASAASGVSK